MRHILVLAVGLMASQVMANEPPPVPEGGLIALASTPCQDAATKEQGQCFVMQDVQGNVYVSFYQGETLMFIRRPLGDSYEDIWVNERFNTF